MGTCRSGSSGADQKDQADQQQHGRTWRNKTEQRGTGWRERTLNIKGVVQIRQWKMGHKSRIVSSDAGSLTSSSPQEEVTALTGYLGYNNNNNNNNIIILLLLLWAELIATVSYARRYKWLIKRIMLKNLIKTKPYCENRNSDGYI